MGCCISLPNSDASPSRPVTANANRRRRSGSNLEHDTTTRSDVAAPAASGAMTGNTTAVAAIISPSASSSTTPTGALPQIESPSDHHNRTCNNQHRHHPHNRHRRRNSPSQPLPNSPLRQPPPSSLIRCPLDIVTTTSPTSITSPNYNNNNSNNNDNTSSRRRGRANTNNSSSSHPISPVLYRSPTGTINQPWTRTRLEKERAAFFDTRVTDAPEIWDVVRTVAELLRTREPNDLATAQGLLDAAGCTSPSGDLARGVFDERGRLYEVPVWVFGDPGDLVEDEGEKEKEVDRGDRDNDDGDDDDDENGRGDDGDGDSWIGKDEELDVDIVGRESGTDDGSDVDREVKKKTRTTRKLKGISVGQRGGRKKEGQKGDKGRLTKVRIRLSDRSADVEVGIGAQENVGVLVARAREHAGLSTKAKIRIVYLGRVLVEQESLLAQGWCEGHVVNGLVFGS